MDTRLTDEEMKGFARDFRRTGGYNEEKLQLIEADCKYGLSKTQIEMYAKREFSYEVMKALSNAFRAGCSDEMVSYLIEMNLDNYQIDTAVGFFKDGADFEIIKAVVEQRLNAHGMKAAYKNMIANLKQKEMSEKEMERVDKTYVDSLFEEMRTIISQINYDEKRFDELNAKIKEISNGKVSDKELEELYQKLADKDAIISNQQDNINQANAALARLRKDSDSRDDEKKKLLKQIEQLSTQLADKDEEISALRNKAKEPEETSMDREESKETATPDMIPLKDANGMVVYGIPVHYAIASKPEGAKEAEYSVIERTERKNSGLAAMFGKLAFKKKSRQDIVKLVASGNLTPDQLVQIRIGIEKKLTENQLINLINNNVPADQMKEIIEIAVLENSMQ